MALTDKLYDFGKTAAITVAALTLFPNYSDAQLLRRKQRAYPTQTIERTVEQTPVRQAEIQSPSYEEFKQVLTKKGKYDEKRENDLRDYWTNLGNSERNYLFEMQKDPEGYLSSQLKTEEQLKKARDFFEKYKPTAEKKQEILKFLNYKGSLFGFKEVPWKYDSENLDMSDKIFFKTGERMLEEMPKAFNSMFNIGI